MADNTALKPVILESDLPVFAVLDGAQFDDLPNALFEGDFAHRPLYLDRGNGTADQLRTAPQLVWLDRDQRSHRQQNIQHDTHPLEAVLQRLFALVGNSPAMVFWVCASGCETLYRHLRGINKVLYPKPEHRHDPVPDNGFDFVVFRHADANVMAQVGPALPESAVSRLLGPVDAIIFAPDPEWNPKPMRIQRHANLPPVPLGPLKLDRRTADAIGAARLEKSRRRVMNYLRSTDPQTETMSDRELRINVIRFEEDGAELGLKSERAHAQWAFLLSTTGGEFGREKQIRDALKSSPDPDRALSELMQSMVKIGQAETQGKRLGEMG